MHYSSVMFPSHVYITFKQLTKTTDEGVCFNHYYDLNHTKSRQTRASEMQRHNMTLN